MEKLNRENLKKTVYYLKRNGLKNTWYVVREHMSRGQSMPQGAVAPYCYVPPGAEQLAAQKSRVKDMDVRFSIIVPLYRTPEGYLRDMITSVIEQSYYRWELILADATEDDSVKRVVEGMCRELDQRSGREKLMSGSLRYLPLRRNEGISGNTNQALQYATGDYVGLLDHDDVLAPDALYEMAMQIQEGRGRGQAPLLLYSDEDKCDSGRTQYYEPHRKEKFNLDLFLSNNYMCHFMVLERRLLQDLGFRREYDGAQDYDLALRAVERLQQEEGRIAHVPKVLYHWRCHQASTAANPASKEYAYEAGRRALQDYADRNGWKASARHLPYLGFYKLVYRPGSPRDAKGSLKGMLEEREDLGAVGGSILRKGRITGGRMDGGGRVFYEGLPVHYGGSFHRAQLTQDGEAVDIRFLFLREELHPLYEEVVGAPYQPPERKGRFAARVLPEGTDYKALSLELCSAVRQRGYRIAYNPGFWVRENTGKVL